MRCASVPCRCPAAAVSAWELRCETLARLVIVRHHEEPAPREVITTGSCDQRCHHVPERQMMCCHVRTVVVQVDAIQDRDATWSPARAAMVERVVEPAIEQVAESFDAVVIEDIG